MSEIKLTAENVRKEFQVKKKHIYTALEDVTLSIEKNEFVCMVGPSGCGKSTLLRLFAGLDFPTKGSVKFDGEEIIGPSAQRGMVFQSYTLFPWLTVKDNICYGLKLQKIPAAEQYRIADRYLKIIGLEDFAQSYPKELSGGMKQRVAIARALANSPEMLLMDEPFGALDPFTKSSMQLLMREIWQQEKTTVVFVTHDIEEAVFLGTKVFVMTPSPGKVAKVIDIDLPEKRTLDIKETKEFFDLKHQITNVFKKKVG